jgi:hypothetical protein
MRSYGYLKKSERQYFYYFKRFSPYLKEQVLFKLFSPINKRLIENIDQKVLQLY